MPCFWHEVLRFMAGEEMMADWIYRPNRHGKNSVIRAANATGKSEEIVTWWDEECEITAQDVEEINRKWAGKILHWTPRRPE